MSIPGGEGRGIFTSPVVNKRRGTWGVMWSVINSASVHNKRQACAALFYCTRPVFNNNGILGMFQLSSPPTWMKPFAFKKSPKVSSPIQLVSKHIPLCACARSGHVNFPCYSRLHIFLFFPLYDFSLLNQEKNGWNDSQWEELWKKCHIKRP